MSSVLFKCLFFIFKQEEAANEVKVQQNNAKQILVNEDLTQFAIKGSEDDWKRMLETGGTAKSLITIKR